MPVLRERVAWSRPKASRGPDLTPEEAKHVKAALAFLRARYGSWPKAAAAMSLKPMSVRYVAGKRGGVTAGMYLHAMCAPPSTSDIEGMICGPGLSLRYRMSMASQTRVHLHVVPRRSTPRADARLYRSFLREIQNRIQDERRRPEHHPKLTPGQFYLRRHVPGVHRTHRNCIAAVAAGVLDQDFVSQLYAWDLRLIRGRVR